MIGRKFLVPAALFFLLVAVSGCTTTDVTSLVKALPSVQDFLKDHPNADINAVYLSKDNAEQIIDSIREDCGDQMEARDYWKVDIKEGNINLRVYLDYNSNQLLCLRKEAVSSAACTEGETIKCGSTIGECKEGIQTCKDGKWGDCEGSVGPQEELCDSLDNNCNGKVDENCKEKEEKKGYCGDGKCEYKTFYVYVGENMLAEIYGVSHEVALVEIKDSNYATVKVDGQKKDVKVGEYYLFKDNMKLVVKELLSDKAYVTYGETTHNCPQDCKTGMDCSTQDISYVCGKDGKTYKNECYAKAAGTAKACAGECPCASSVEAFCGNGVCEKKELKIAEGEIKDITMENKKYRLNLLSVLSSTSAKLKVNEQDVVVEKNKYYTTDSLNFYVYEITYYGPTAGYTASYTTSTGAKGWVKLHIIEDNTTCPKDCNKTMNQTNNTVCTPGQNSTCGQSNVGECRYGYKVCNTQGSAWGECTGYVDPVTEICDGKDNDCDGQIDNGLTCTNETNQTNNTVCTPYEVRACGEYSLGECRLGNETCFANGTGWGVCMGYINPVTEICDSKDNDCDGQIDEGGVCSSGLPDLTVSSSSAEIVSSMLMVKMNISNIGEAEYMANQSLILFSIIQVNVTGMETGYVTIPSPIAAGGSESTFVLFGNVTGVMNRTMVISVDPYNMVEESDEYNNLYIFSQII